MGQMMVRWSSEVQVSVKPQKNSELDIRFILVIKQIEFTINIRTDPGFLLFYVNHHNLGGIHQTFPEFYIECLSLQIIIVWRKYPAPPFRNSISVSTCKVQT